MNLLTRRRPSGDRYTDLQLLPKELQAIGHVAAQWAFLEFLILIETKGLANYLKIDLPENANAVSFNKRKSAWETLAWRALENSEAWQRTETLLREIADAANDRNRLMHSFIQYEETNPVRLKAFPKENPGKFGWSLDAAKIEGIAAEIAEINYRLLSIHRSPQVAHGVKMRTSEKPNSRRTSSKSGSFRRQK